MNTRIQGIRAQVQVCTSEMGVVARPGQSDQTAQGNGTVEELHCARRVASRYGHFRCEKG